MTFSMQSHFRASFFVLQPSTTLYLSLFVIQPSTMPYLSFFVLQPITLLYRIGPSHVPCVIYFSNDYTVSLESNCPCRFSYIRGIYISKLVCCNNMMATSAFNMIDCIIVPMSKGGEIRINLSLFYSYAVQTLLAYHALSGYVNILLVASRFID